MAFPFEHVIPGLNVKESAMEHMINFRIRGVHEEDVFHRQKLIEGWKQDKLSGARVLVAGCGAVGNEVAKNLVLMGIGTLILVDFDSIEAGNLSRTVLFRQSDLGRRKVDVAAERLAEMKTDHHTKIIPLHRDLIWDLGTAWFSQSDLILGCLDNVAARRTLNRMSRLTGVPWIDGGISNFSASMTVFEPKDEVCYECHLNRGERQSAGMRFSCTNIIQKPKPEPAATIQTSAALVASLQCLEAVKRIQGLPSPSGVRHYFNGHMSELHTLTLSPNPTCTAHIARQQGTLVTWSPETSLAQLVKDLETEQGINPPFSLEYGDDGSFSFVKTGDCLACGNEFAVLRPLHRLDRDHLFCSRSCRQHGASRSDPNLHMVTRLDLHIRDKRFSDLRLTDLGIPPFHMIAIRNQNGLHYFQLTGSGTPSPFTTS